MDDRAGYSDLDAFREKPCGRKAEWIVIGDVLAGGAGFVATCRDCYRRTLGKHSPESAEDLVPASVFKDDFGRDPMCGDDDESSGLARAIDEAVARVDEDPVTHLQLVRLLKDRDLKARIHRIAIERRFGRLESSVKILANVAAACLAVLIADASRKWIPWGEWSWGAVFVCVYFLANRLIRLGRFTKHLKTT